jgi:hypothetical protein
MSEIGNRKFQAEKRLAKPQTSSYLRRFAPNIYDSGFRVRPGMTRCFFDGGLFIASPGVHPQPAEKTDSAGQCQGQRPANLKNHKRPEGTPSR